MIAELREEVARLAAEAAALPRATSKETDRVQGVHDEEVATLRNINLDERAHFERALASRDLIGQAKGLLMARGATRTLRSESW